MRFGVYVHIPYCLQRCPYCDFSTYEFTQIPPPEHYVSLLRKEIRQKQNLIPHRQIDTVFFGGGTPSLISAPLIVSILDELSNCGFQRTDQTEVTLEINPATLDHQKMEYYIKHGVNRFSVGAQSFDDRLLKVAGRKHSAADTIATLDLIKSYKINYNFDLLFALPTQTLNDLKRDLDLVSHYDPPHLSAYCLTVPDTNPMSKGRAPESEQVEMFSCIEDTLMPIGLERYEISNYAKLGFESRHNRLYWTDQPFWGLGMSAHSYLPGESFLRSQDIGVDSESVIGKLDFLPKWGARFWNPSSFKEYENQIALQETIPPVLAYNSQYPALFEALEIHQSVTDFCHVSLRIREGLAASDLESKFTRAIALIVAQRLSQLERRELVVLKNAAWVLTRKGWLLSNKVFEELTFLREELPRA